MTVEELLESPYSPDLWQLARDNCQEIMEKFTQTFPAPKIPMPDNATDDDWTSQYINKKDLLRDFRYQNPVTTEWPYNGNELPKYDDSNGWLAFLDKQQLIHSLKQSYLESGDTAYLFKAFITCYKYGFYPPLWVIDNWLFPAFCCYSHYEGKKSLETCLRLKGSQRSGITTAIKYIYLG